MDREICISIIVPCFNEQESLKPLYESLSAELKRLQCSYEILLVNDGSVDATEEIIKGLANQDSTIKYLLFSRNFGKEAAMFAGLRNSKGNYVAIMDADLQDPPSLLPQMLEILKTGEYGCVATRRSNRKGESPIRSWFAKLFYKIINALSDIEIVDGARDYRLMNRKMVDAIISIEEYNRFSKGVFGWVGFKTYWLSYENIERTNGKSKWNFWKLCKYAIDGIVNFSNAPLSIASWFGLVMTVVSIIALIVVIVRRLIMGDPVAGWASTICVIVFIGGIQLFCIGVIGQYLAKTYMETKKRPHYIVEDSNIDNVDSIG